MSVERIDTAALRSLREHEDAEFVRRRPRSRELLERSRASMPGGVPMSWMTGLYEHAPIFPVAGHGAYFEDVDGHRYLDMNQVDIAGFIDFAPAPVTEALSAQAARGSSFLLPTEDGIAVAENLAQRVGLPFWQFTGAASNSNAEAIRLARVSTGRETWRATPLSATHFALFLDPVQTRLEMLYPLVQESAIGFELRLTRPAKSDSALLPLQVGPAAHEPRR